MTAAGPATAGGPAVRVRVRVRVRSSSEMMKLEVPSTRTTPGDRSFDVDGLPASIHDPTLSIRPTVFSNRLETQLFDQQLRPRGVCDSDQTPI